MAVRHPLFVANGTAGVTPPQDARLALAALLSGPGILNGFTVTGSSSGPNMKYNVAAGAVVTQRGTLATDGLYLWSNDGTATVDSGAPAPTSGTRYDVIYALARNANDGFGDANSDTVLGVVVGTASSTPTVPAAPAGALVLAQALVATNAANAAAGATITQVAATAYVGWAPQALQVGAGSALSVPTSTFTTIVGYTQTLYRNGSIGYSTGVFTAVLPGLYRWEVTISIPATTPAHRRLFRAVVNGSLPANGQGSMELDYAGAAAIQTLTVGGLIPLNANDTISIQTWQNTGSTLSYSPNAYSLARVG